MNIISIYKSSCTDSMETVEIDDPLEYSNFEIPMELVHGNAEEPMEVVQYGGQDMSPQPGPSHDNKPYR